MTHAPHFQTDMIEYSNVLYEYVQWNILLFDIYFSNNCSWVKVLSPFSYAPKKMLPPIDIHITLGPIPANNFFAPSSLTIRFIVSTMPV